MRINYHDLMEKYGSVHSMTMWCVGKKIIWKFGITLKEILPNGRTTVFM